MTNQKMSLRFDELLDAFKDVPEVVGGHGEHHFDFKVRVVLPVNAQTQRLTSPGADFGERMAFIDELINALQVTSQRVRVTEVLVRESGRKFFLAKNKVDVVLLVNATLRYSGFGARSGRDMLDSLEVELNHPRYTDSHASVFC